jgi:hypothetical protein
LADKYGFKGYNNSEAHNLLRQYAKFVTRGKRHLIDGRKDEGFLHFMIGLDLVLGEKQQTTAKVTRRAAALIHNHFGLTYVEQEAKLRKLYEVRSRYVHQGQSIDAENITALEAICTEIFNCLLRFQNRKKSAALTSQWQKDIDYMVSAIEAGRIIEPQLLSDVGIEI